MPTEGMKINKPEHHNHHHKNSVNKNKHCRTRFFSYFPPLPSTMDITPNSSEPSSNRSITSTVPQQNNMDLPSTSTITSEKTVAATANLLAPTSSPHTFKKICVQSQLLLAIGNTDTAIEDNVSFILSGATGSKLAIDCGGASFYTNLKKHGLDYGDIDGLYVSYIDSEHINNIVNYALYWWNKRQPDSSIARPLLFISKSFFQSQNRSKPLWENYLKDKLGTAPNGKAVGLKNYFRVIPVGTQESFYWDCEQIILSPVPTKPITDNCTEVSCYDLFIQTPSQKKIFITTNTAYSTPDYAETALACTKLADMIICNITTKPQCHPSSCSDDKVESLPSSTGQKKYYLYYNNEKSDAAFLKWLPSATPEIPVNAGDCIHILDLRKDRSYQPQEAYPPIDMIQRNFEKNESKFFKPKLFLNVLTENMSSNTPSDDQSEPIRPRSR